MYVNMHQDSDRGLDPASPCEVLVEVLAAEQTPALQPL
jgi:hypothetical protein